VPQLRSEQLELIDPARNPFFGHARAQLFVAERDGAPIGRISAHIDELALELPPEQGMGPGAGMFGYFDAEDEQAAHALLAKAEEWLRQEGMTRVLGPISMPVKEEFPPLIRRIVASGERNERIKVRYVDKAQWDREVRIVLEILNDAWSDNWGFVPFTDRETAYAGKKLRPLIHEEINMIAELDGKPAAFMLTFPDVNDVLRKTGGKLLPFGWLRLLRWARNPEGAGMRVPLMGVRKELHNSRLASQLAFMMISQIRHNAAEIWNSERGEIGWVLDDNKGMVAIAETIGATVNREYAVFQKPL
jgi:hypothetical protein